MALASLDFCTGADGHQSVHLSGLKSVKLIQINPFNFPNYAKLFSLKSSNSNFADIFPLTSNCTKWLSTTTTATKQNSSIVQSLLYNRKQNIKVTEVTTLIVYYTQSGRFYLWFIFITISVFSAAAAATRNLSHLLPNFVQQLIVIFRRIEFQSNVVVRVWVAFLNFLALILVN